MRELLFTPIPITVWQMLCLLAAAGSIGWIVAVTLHFDSIDETLCQLHATDPAPNTAPALTVVLDTLSGLFTAHRELMWRHAVLKGKPRDGSVSLTSTAALARAYTVLRAHGRTPSTAEWPADLRERATDEPLRSAAR